MKPHLQRVEVEPLGSGNDDLAIDDTAVGQPESEGVVELGKVAVQRLQVAALDEHLAGSAAKDDRAEAVPLRFVEKRTAGRERFGNARQHRLDWRLDCEPAHVALAARASGASFGGRTPRL